MRKGQLLEDVGHRANGNLPSEILQKILKHILQRLHAPDLVAFQDVPIDDGIHIPLQQHDAGCRVQSLHVGEAPAYHVVRKRLP